MIQKQILADFIRQKGLPDFRVRQILRALFAEGHSTFDEIHVLPKSLREELRASLMMFSLNVEREVSSETLDTTKTLFRLRDNKFAEGVLMRFKDGRNSVCVSSQVGCGLKCAFCATGTMGFIRNLTAEEIADQVWYFDQRLRQRKSRVDHVVFMGMGEPFLNYDAVMQATTWLVDSDYFCLSPRRITVSTSGVIPGIEKLTAEKIPVNLAVSLHAPNQALREKLMPIAKAYKLDALMAAIKAYTQKTRRRISYEYVMLREINDTPELAHELGLLAKGQLCHVNLIPYNETYLGFSNSGKSRINRFRDIVASYKIPVTVRVSLGQDISAACGQLAIERSA